MQPELIIKPGLGLTPLDLTPTLSLGVTPLDLSVSGEVRSHAGRYLCAGCCVAHGLSAMPGDACACVRCHCWPTASARPFQSSHPCPHRTPRPPQVGVEGEYQPRGTVSGTTTFEGPSTSTTVVGSPVSTTVSASSGAAQAFKNALSKAPVKP